MAEFLTWRAEWRTGIDWIDTDHHEIVLLLNQLVAENERATRSPDAPKDGVLATMDALIEHTRRHFLAEEAFLRQIRFPGYNEHRCEHVLQTAEFADMRRALGQEPGPVLGSETLQDLKRWFFNHVIAEDRAYVDYYRSAIETGLPA